jgi:TRAP-type C4-dicarboxylate transport system substrate-binding protein
VGNGGYNIRYSVVKNYWRRVKMKHWKAVSLFFGLSLVGLSFIISPACVQAKPIELAYSNFFPAPHKMAVLSVEWGKEVEKRTNGQVKVTVYPGGTLTPAAQCYDGVVKGLSDVGLSVLGYSRGRFPLTEVIDLPLGYNKGLEATKLINLYYKKFKPKEFDDVKVMYLHAHGPGIISTKKPVSTLEELKGMKISCHGLSAKIIAALGAVPVAMPMPDRYDAIQKGVAEGGAFPAEALKGWKLAEVVGATTQNFGSAYTTGFFVVMNKDKWASIPADLQKVIESVNEEWIVKTGEAWDEIDKIGYDLAISKGVKIIKLSKAEDARWHEKVQPILGDYVTATKAKNLPGDAALKFCQEELKKLQK